MEKTFPNFNSLEASLQIRFKCVLNPLTNILIIYVWYEVSLSTIKLINLTISITPNITERTAKKFTFKLNLDSIMDTNNKKNLAFFLL